jgi:2-succinyl-6-hydroxy-2,4-cyclohexadiene-1-carboxylate synthase
MTTLFLLHGFAGAPASFQPLLEALGVQVKIVSVTLSGHGGDASLGTVTSFEDEVERLERRLFREADEPAHLIGYSMGARLGLGLAAAQRPRLASATLIGAHPGLASERARRERVQADEHWCSLLENEPLEAFVDAWESQPLFATQRELDPELLAKQRRIRLSHHPLGLAGAMRALGLGNMPCLLEALSEVRVPVQLVVGERDARRLPAAREMCDALERSRLVVAPGAGHNVVLERPAWLANVMKDWVST